MGTETITLCCVDLVYSGYPIKLNNPLMGTETNIRQFTKSNISGRTN